MISTGKTKVTTGVEFIETTVVLGDFDKLNHREDKLNHREDKLNHRLGKVLTVQNEAALDRGTTNSPAEKSGTK
ncbi:MAG: hypothetical protein HUK25_09825 [Treponema sp.]|nr:hypothetical protein [Treponema sp.]